MNGALALLTCVALTQAAPLPAEEPAAELPVDFTDAFLLDPSAPEEGAKDETSATSAMNTESIDAAMARLAMEKNTAGLKLLSKHRYPDALAQFRAAFDLSPDNAEIANNLGYAHALLGNEEEAETLYRQALALDPRRAVAHLNLSDLLVERFPDRASALQEAAELLVRTRELQGATARIILRQARLEVLRGDHLQAERFYDEYLQVKRPTDRLKLELGDFYRDMGRPDEAMDWYRRVEAPEQKKLADERIWKLEVEAQSVAFGWSSAEIPDKAKKLVTNARKLFSKRRYARAATLFKEAIALAPTYTDAMVGYGDLLYRTGRAEEAELYYLRALTLAFDDPDIYAKLATLYLSSRQREHTASAAIYLKRALELRPQWTDLELQLALALRETGDALGALDHVKIFLSRETKNERKRRRAMKLKQALETLLPAEDLMESGSVEADLKERVTGMTPELIDSLRQARAHLKRGELDASMAALRSIPDDQRNPVVLNLEARILLGAGRDREAIAVLEESLRKEETQAIIHEQLGLAFMEVGNRRRARIHFLRAEELGDAGATYLLARLDAGDADDGPVQVFRDVWRIASLTAARDRLRGFLESEPSSIYHSEARGLSAQVEQRMKALLMLAAAGGLLLVLGMLGLAHRLWGGSDLRRLILEYPDAGIAVQRILSAVRHEVLKHNTMMMVGLVEAMAAGEDVGERMRHFRRQMLGENGAGGVSARLANYVRELQRIGDTYKTRLNLRRRDPATASLLKGMQIITANGEKLARWDALSSGEKDSLRRDLKAASVLLNIEGYEAVRALLDNLRSLTVDESLIRDIYERCRLEPSFAGTTFAPLRLEMDAPSAVRIAVPRAAFEDILTNLIRNAIQSSLLYGDTPDEVALAMSVATETDLVTGIERVALFVKDRSRKSLTVEMLRGRYIEEGLGLTADLVTRYDGTLDVVQGDGQWTKAVVVKLPVAADNGDRERGR